MQRDGSRTETETERHEWASGPSIDVFFLEGRLDEEGRFVRTMGVPFELVG